MRNAKILVLTLLGVMIAASGALAQEAVVAAGATPPAMTLPPDLQPMSCYVSNESLSSGFVVDGDGRVEIVLARDMPGEFQFSVARPSGVEVWTLAAMLNRDGSPDTVAFGMANKPPFDVTSIIETPETGFSVGEGCHVELPPALLAALRASPCVADNDLSSHAMLVEVTAGVYELWFPSGGVALLANQIKYVTSGWLQFGPWVKVCYIYGENENGEATLHIIVYVQDESGRWVRALRIRLQWVWPAIPSGQQGVIIEQPLHFAGFLEALSELDAFLMERLGPAAREQIDELWRELWEALCALPEFAAVTTVSEP